MVDLLNSKIEYFVRCAKEKSLNEAAFKIGLSQSALSTAIKKLEEELNITLFDRYADGIKLTTEGKLLYDRFISHQKQLQREVLSCLDRNKQLALRIGVTSAYGFRYLIPLLKKLKDQLPPVQIVMVRSLHSYEAVRDGGLDFAIVAWTRKPSSEVNSIYIKKEVIEVVGLKKAFPEIAKIKKLSQLKDYPWVYFPKPQYNLDETLEVHKSGYLVHGLFEVKNIILSGLAIGEVQMDVFTEKEMKLLVRSPSPPLHPNVGIYLLHRHDLPKKTQEYMDLILSHLK